MVATIARPAQVWETLTVEIRKGDYVRLPYVPIVQVLERYELPDGKVTLYVQSNAGVAEAWLVEPAPQLAEDLTSYQPPSEATTKREWKVSYDPQWDWYYVWVGERLAGRASNHQEAEQLAQRYIATDALIAKQNAAVLTAWSK